MMRYLLTCKTVTVKKSILNTFVVLFVLGFSIPNSYAQVKTNTLRWSKNFRTPAAYRDWMLSVSGGSALYFGENSNYDLDPLNKIKTESNLSYSISAGKWVKPYLAMRANFQMGKLNTIKSSHEMTANFNEYTAQLMLNVTDFFDYPSGYQRRLYSYVYLGYGLIDFKSAYYTNAILENEVGTDKMQTEWVVPIGFGLAYNYNQNFTFAFDASYHYINTDVLDAYSYSGSTSKDFLIYIGLSVNYNFNLKYIEGFIVRPKSRRSLKWTKF